MHRMMLIAETPTFHVSNILMKAVCEAVIARNDMQIAAVCFRRPASHRTVLARYGLSLAKHYLQRVVDVDKQYRCVPPVPLHVERLSVRCGFPIISPPNQDINDDGFIRTLQEEIRPTVSLSIYCLQKFGVTLLNTLQTAINYHNGMLPGFRGVRATHWSVYCGERVSGFSFHRMEPEWDTGPVLIDGAVPILPKDSIADLELKKAYTAAERVPQLLNMLADNAPGTPQQGETRFFIRKEFNAKTTIEDPAIHTSDELIKRIRAFGLVLIKIGDTWFPVTKFRSTSSRVTAHPERAFKTRDGIWIMPIRFNYLPWPVYRLLRPMLLRKEKWRRLLNRLIH